MIKVRFAKWIKSTLFITILIGSVVLAIWLATDKNPSYFTRSIEALGERDHQTTPPRKSFYIRMDQSGAAEAVDFEIPFTIRQCWWWETPKGTEFRIEFAGNADSESEAYKRCGYTIEIIVNNNQAILWYGHNLKHSALPALNDQDAILGRLKDGSIIAQSKTHQSGNTIWIVMPIKGLEVDAVRLFYTPSREAFEASSKQMVMVSSWVKNPSPWGNRVRRIPGSLRWVETRAEHP